MPNPQESGSHHNQGISKEKEGAGQQQQQQPAKEKPGQQDSQPNTQRGEGSHQK